MKRFGPSPIPSSSLPSKWPALPATIAVAAMAVALTGCGDDDDGAGGAAGYGGYAGSTPLYAGSGGSYWAGAGGGGIGGTAGAAGAAGSAGQGGEGGAAGEGGTAGADAGAGGVTPEQYAQAAASQLSSKLLVVLMDFADSEFVPSAEQAQADWAELLFGTEISQGNHFWYEVSHGQFQLLPAEENGGTPNDGVVHVKRPELRPTSADGQLVIEDQGWFQDTLDQLATDGVVDFAFFDTDGDGSLGNTELAVHLILNMEYENIALAAAQANILLGDWITTTGHTIAGTGPILERFARGQYRQIAIGVHMHELAHHIFDLDHFVAPTDHGLMGQGAYGGNNAVPTHLVGYNKVKCGFASMTDVSEPAIGIELHSAHTGQYNLIRIPLANGTFLLLENREARGYDASIPFCEGHTGGLFATVTNTHLVPLGIATLESEHDLTDYDPQSSEVCDTYLVAGHNEPFSIGGYTIKNVSQAGPVMTFDLEKLPVVPAIEHYKFNYWVDDPDREGYRKWHTQMAVENGSIDIDASGFVDGDDPTATFTISMTAFYNTFDRQKVNSYASWSESSDYLELEILPMTPGEFPLDDTIIRFSLVQGAPYSPTATVNVSHQGFNTSFRYINLPSY